MKQLTREEAQFHVKLSDRYDPIYVCRNAHAYLLTPCTEEGWEGWEDVSYYSEAIFDASGSIRKPEWIYVLVNRSIPGMCKIGFTTTSVPKRTKEINQSTGVPTPWFPVFSFKCVGARYLEEEIHQKLEQFRVASNREMFQIDSLTAQSVVEELGQRFIVNIPADIMEEINKASTDDVEPGDISAV